MVIRSLILGLLLSAPHAQGLEYIRHLLGESAKPPTVSEDALTRQISA